MVPVNPPASRSQAARSILAARKATPGLIQKAIGLDTHSETVADRMAESHGIFIMRTTFPGLIYEGEAVGFQCESPEWLRPGWVVMAAYIEGDIPTFGPLLVSNHARLDDEELRHALELPSGRLVLDDPLLVVAGKVVTFHRGTSIMADEDGLRFQRIMTEREVSLSTDRGRA